MWLQKVRPQGAAKQEKTTVLGAFLGRATLSFWSFGAGREGTCGSTRREWGIGTLTFSLCSSFCAHPALPQEKKKPSQLTPQRGFSENDDDDDDDSSETDTDEDDDDEEHGAPLEG